MRDVLLTIVGAVAGSSVAYYLPILHNLTSNPRRKKLAGNWNSASYASDQHGWVFDSVAITVSMTAIKLTNQLKPHGYDYDAVARLVKNQHLVGHWHSTRDAATNEGPFALTLDPQGEYMFGFYGGKNKDCLLYTSPSPRDS